MGECRPGPAVRTDIAELHVVRAVEGGAELLQLLRAQSPMAGTWQPVMGHIEAGESAVGAIVREAREELGLELAGPGARLYALEQSVPYFLPGRDAIFLSPRFACVVGGGFAPVLNEEHDDWRWLRLPTDGEGLEGALRGVHWPSQRVAVREIVSEILAEGSVRAQIGDDLRRGS